MATFAQIWTQIANALKIPEDLKSAGTTFRTNQATYDASLVGENVNEGSSAISAIRSQLASALSTGDAATLNHFAELAITLGVDQSDPETLMDPVLGDLFQYMIDNSQSVNSRAFTFGSLVATGSLGSESLNETTFATHAKWDVTGDGDDTGGNFTHTHATGASTLTQTNANMAVAGVPRKWYRFDYTISSPSGDATLAITTAWALQTQTLSTTAGTHTLYFLSNDNAATADFVISGTSSSGAITIDDVTLKQVSGMVGNTNIYRLTTDRNSQDIENCAASTKEFKCIADQNTGASGGQEEWQVRHLSNFHDELDWLHHGDSGTFIGKDPENGLGTNMSFQELSGTVNTNMSANDTITGWEVATGLITDMQFTDNDTFQSSPTEKGGTAYSLQLSANAKLVQTLRTEGQNIDLTVPHIFIVHYKAQNSCDGTLTIRLGSNTASATVTGAIGWQTLALTMDQNLWYSNFDEDDLDLEIELSSNTTGELLLDYMIFDEMEPFDGHWWAIVSGDTFALVDDTFTFTDALSGSEAVIQYWLWRYFNSYLPHNGAGAETINDP